MKCPECKTTLRGNSCPCGWRKAAAPVAKTSPCQKCGEVHAIKYLKNWNGLEICSDCLSTQGIPPADREYFRAIAREYKVPLVDIKTHLLAANTKNIKLEDYLATLPRSREEFREYFKDGITIGGITL